MGVWVPTLKKKKIVGRAKTLTCAVHHAYGIYDEWQVATTKKPKLCESWAGVYGAYKCRRKCVRMPHDFNLMPPCAAAQQRLSFLFDMQ